MYIFVWEATQDQPERARLYPNLEDACAAIVGMRIPDLPRHIIRMSPRIFAAPNYSFDQILFWDFFQRNRSILTNLAIRALLDRPSTPAPSDSPLPYNSGLTEN